MNSLCLEHVSEKLLERYLAHQGSESEVEVVETHLLICDSCRGRLDELEDYRSAMRQGFALLASQPQQSKAPGWFRGLPAWSFPSWSWNFRRSWPRWSPKSWLLIPAAATLALAAFLVVGPVDVSLTSERGGETPGVSAPKGRNLQLHLDSSGLPDGQVSVEIVDSNGNAITEQQTLANSNHATIGVAPLTGGVYYARIYSSKGGHLDSDRLLREFAFQVR
jgi:hypothetical protein